MKKVIVLSSLVLALAWLFPAQAPALTAREIMEKVDARDDGDNVTTTQEMILIDKNGSKRVRQMRSFSKDKGKDTLRLIFFLSPADVKDTGFLTFDYYSGEKDDDQWLYLPELKKTKRIASSDKSSSFMGSDFSYADMTRRVLDEWKYKLLKEVDVRGKKTWLIECLPASKAVEERYGYTKTWVLVRQDIFFVVRGVSWTTDNKIKYMDAKTVEKIDNILFATEMDMKTTKNKRTLHRTVLKFSNVKFNQQIEEEMFSVRRLEKGI